MEGLLIGSLAEPLTRSLRLLKYARIKITATEVRTKVHYKIDTVTVELDEVNWNNVTEKRINESFGTTEGNLEPRNPASTSIIRNGKRLVLNQGNLPTCGDNSRAMILDIAGMKYDLNKLITDSKVGSNGARMTDLVTALKNQGINDARFASKTSLEDISSATANGIVAMKLDRGYHAVVVDGVTIRNGQTVVAIRDPALGR
ncbi:hypothetical protein JMI89_04795 [Frischella sp. Ac48]|uniref:cysteine peptidase family C39 domain-containing protein n=1 Tax=Frischella sp. Ac48 TaxID=2804531 RepID=UPI001C7D5F93|nr:cysteine peptidase family C39 domain-containing protein [Frischella sp. Ac48]MBX4132944.1 hypothetical protein [Frischella sp. Ac48]